MNQISIAIPPLRERKEDIVLLFRKFASDVAEKYKMPLLKLSDDGRQYLMDYPWYGNVRELKNVTEQIAVVETERLITRDILMNYIHYVPDEKMPVLFQPEATTNAISDRELLLKALSMGQMINEMRTEINNLKQIITSMARQGVQINGGIADEPAYIDGEKYYQLDTQPHTHSAPYAIHPAQPAAEDVEFQDSEVVENDGVALFEREKAAIVRALDRHRGRRRPAAADLGISERTLYRKIKEYGIEY